MSNKQSAEIREIQGCMQVVGMLCVSLAVGAIWGTAYGWLSFGVFLLVLSIF